MVNERQLIARLEAADAKQLALIIAGRTAEEERVLRTHLGDARFERMRDLMLQTGTRSGAANKGNVVVLHGIMGSELTYYITDAQPERIWISIFRIITGEFSRFSLDGRGGSQFRVQATGILKRYYGELLLSLMQQGWNTHAFWFDWRLDVNASADQLATKIDEWFGNSGPVHLVAHSMGGLVARAFINKHRQRWQSGASANGSQPGRLVMLGTPNYGSFAIPLLLMGLNDVIKKLDIVDVRHNLDDLLRIIATFVGTYQMLPSPFVMPEIAKLYDASTYLPLATSPSRLALARESHQAFNAMVPDPERMSYIAGFNRSTVAGIRDWEKLHSMDGYSVTKRGDGTVPHSLGLLKVSNGSSIPTFYIDEEHGALPSNQMVIAAVNEFLEAGATSRLPREIPSEVRGEEAEAVKQQAQRDLVARHEAEWARLREMITPMQTVAKSRGDEPEEPPVLSETERESEELLIRQFASAKAEPAAVVPVAATATVSSGTAAPPVPRIRIRLVRAPIQEAGLLETEGELPVDAIAVGHYVGVKPVAAEKALDEAISAGLRNKLSPSTAPSSLPSEEADLVLTHFTERGIVRGDLGQIFLLDDPRARDDGRSRLIAIAGMGYPGRFGVPELAMLARELTWSLGRLGKRHLATVLIGSGNGNLPIHDAISGWLEGVLRATGGSAEDASRHVETITFVENQAGKLLRLWSALQEHVQNPQIARGIDLVPLTPEEVQKLEDEAREEDLKHWKERRQAGASEDRLKSEIPTRLTVDLDVDTYRFGAITEDASMPERAISLDPDLVSDANDQLAAQRDNKEQANLGVFLEKLLIPSDLQPLLSSNAPLVLTCDSTVARIHWEMVSQPGLDVPDENDNRPRINFLGIHRGFTRQLRTPFAPVPEPPPPPNRILRVLIIGDPAADNPLPGAQEEAILVRDLFNQFRNQRPTKSISDVKVITLLGPLEATRTRVLEELILKPYDVLHYAGHCKYDRDKPSASGWIFTGDKRLSARELGRIDRIPKFVFSNACESGITPDRSEKRSPELAPSFAESFFARGVQNFVCTAWPVNDLAARDFAKRLYSGLLGLAGKGTEPMHVAMREARLAIFSQPYGLRTWGAYQHYGNPYFRLFR